MDNNVKANVTPQVEESNDLALKDCALILIGFQNDYFSPDGILHGVIENGIEQTAVLTNTLLLLENVGDKFGLVISTPIVFTSDYQELVDPVGVLKTIKDEGAFKADSFGGATIKELDRFSSIIRQVPGKKGLNAFSETELAKILNEHYVKRVYLAGVITSLCIDSTARSAVDNNFKVTVLEDCTYGRSKFEQSFYCENIFPLYADVSQSSELTSKFSD